VTDSIGEYHPPPRRSIHQASACMGFAGRPKGERFTWDTVLQVPFRALGMLVWGVTNDTLVHDILVGHTSQLAVSGVGFPARFFEAGLSFSELTRLFSDEDEATAMARAYELPSQAESASEARCRDFFEWMKKYPHVEEHQRIEIDTCSPGQGFSITISGPIEALAVWGNALR
jgi:hypothetical protein